MNSSTMAPGATKASAIIFTNFLTKLFRQRHLVWNFVVRDLRSRYVGSFMGLFWAVVHPLVLLVCYSVVFSKIFDIRLKFPQIGDNFAIFLFAGLLPWLYFQDTLSRSCESVVGHSNLVRKTAFSAEILPLTIVFSNLFTHLVGLAIFAAVLLYYQTLGWCLLLLPLYWILLGGLALGLGWIASALHVFLRDTAQVLAVALTFWFWFTPIFYRIEDAPDSLRPWLRLNPLGAVVEGYRDILLAGRLPDATALLILVAWSVAAFVVGGFVFRNTKRDFADVL